MTRALGEWIWLVWNFCYDIFPVKFCRWLLSAKRFGGKGWADWVHIEAIGGRACDFLLFFFFFISLSIFYAGGLFHWPSIQKQHGLAYENAGSFFFFFNFVFMRSEKDAVEMRDGHNSNIKITSNEICQLKCWNLFCWK